LPMAAALVVLASHVRARAWRWITLAQLAVWMVFTVPIDWFAYYRVPARPPVRVYAPPPRGGQQVDRADYRLRATRLDPIFGAVAGLHYGLNRSPDGMPSVLSRIAPVPLATTSHPPRLQ